MNAYESAPVAANNRGAENIANLAGLQAQNSTARPLRLFVVDEGRVVCQLDVQAEHLAGGWLFEGYIPGRVLP